MRNKTFLTLIIFFAFVAVMSWSGVFSRKEKVAERTKSEKTAYEMVMEIDLDQNYPGDPQGVIKLNNEITVLLYGGAILEEQIEPVILQQRMLFAKELLDLNQAEAQVLMATAQIEDIKNAGQRVLGVTYKEPVYDPADDNLCSVYVMQFTSTNVSNSLKYDLIKEGGKWKILQFYFAEEGADANE